MIGHRSLITKFTSILPYEASVARYIKLPRYKISTFQKSIFWNCRNYSSIPFSLVISTWISSFFLISNINKKFSKLDIFAAYLGAEASYGSMDVKFVNSDPENHWVRIFSKKCEDISAENLTFRKIWLLEKTKGGDLRKQKIFRFFYFLGVLGAPGPPPPVIKFLPHLKFSMKSQFFLKVNFSGNISG